MHEELRLLDEMLDGGEGAVRVFIDRYAFLLKGVFRRFRQFSPEDCEDLFVEFFQRLWENDRRLLRQIRRDWGGGSLAGYLRRMARNLAIDRIRQMHNVEQVGYEHAPEPMADDPDPALLGELRRMIVAAFQQLEERCREAVRLVDLEGYEYLEAAELLGLTRTAFGVALMRCRQKLLEIFDRDFPALRLYLAESL